MHLSHRHVLAKVILTGEEEHGDFETRHTRPTTYNIHAVRHTTKTTLLQPTLSPTYRWYPLIVAIIRLWTSASSPLRFGH
jgi:hypothetical protein